jgi:HK97 family phage prohead protease
MDHDKLTAMLDAGLPEFRSVPFLDFESTDDGWGFRGLAGVYEESADIGDFTEEFARGAYRRVIASGENTRLAYDHSPPHVPVLATLRAKTMALKDDVRGLDVRASIAKHYIGEAARELIKRGDIRGMSPGMIVGRGNSDMTMRGEKPHRVIRNLKHLPEVSITPDPAYAGTTAELRSMWAFQMAESVGLSQHALVGAYPQLEGRATDLEADTGDEPVKVATCEKCGNEPCACEPVEEQRSGADADASAARKRRLQMMGLSLPR